MTEETSKVIERRRNRSFRKKSSNSKTDTVDDPSALAVTTATSTGIEASLLEKNASRESVKDVQIPRKSKKKKKSKSDSSKKSVDDIMDSQKSLGKKSKHKKSKRSDAVGESLKPSTTKVPSMFASASPKTKKKKSKDPSGHSKTKSKSKSKSKKVDGETRSRKYPSSSRTSSEPIAKSASRDGSLRDIKLANSVDSNKRDTAISRLRIGSLPTLSTLGDSSIDDDDMPFWKRSTGGSRRNSPIASLEEDDTIITNDDDYMKLGKYQYPEMKTMSQPPLSDQDDDSDEYSSSSEESSSSDEEPEWLRKKKMFQAKGEKVAYEPPPKQPDPPAETKDEGEDANDEKEKANLPAWANARKTLKKTNNLPMTGDSAPVVKEKEKKSDNQPKKEEQDASMSGLPSWAQARRATMKKTESTRNTATAPSKSSSLPKESGAKAENGEASKTGLPVWTQARRTSLWKTESAKDTSAPVKAEDKGSEKEQIKKEDEQDRATSGLPAWANARKTLKPSGSGMNLVASTPVDGDDKGEKNNDDAVLESEKKPGWIGKKRTEVKKKSTSVGSSSPSTQTTESETDASDRQPPWAKARNSLKSSGARSVNSSAPTEKIRNSDGDKNSDEALAKANGSSVGGASLWVNKKSDTVPAKAADDKDKPDEDEPKSVKDRLSMWGKPNQSRPPRVQSERNFTSTATSIASKDDLKLKKPKMGKTLSERSMSSLGSQDSQGTSDSHRDRMAAYLEKTRSKADSGKPPLGVDKNKTPHVPVRGLSVKDRTKAWGESNHSSRDGDASSIGAGSAHSVPEKDDSETTDTNSNGRTKAKTYSANSSPVPEYAAGRIALKKVKKDDEPSDDKDRANAPKLTRMYSSEKLKKVTPPLASKPKEDETLGSSTHSAPKLRKVGKPNEQKWKEKKTEDKPSDENPMANLKKVSPPDEKKWLSPKVQEEGAGKLYSSQHELLRSVKPPIEDKSTGSADSLDSPKSSAAEFAEASLDENLDKNERNEAPEQESPDAEETVTLEHGEDKFANNESIPAENINIGNTESEPSGEEKDEKLPEAEDSTEDRANTNDTDEKDSLIEDIKDSVTDSEELDTAATPVVTSDDDEMPENTKEEVQAVEQNDEQSSISPSSNAGNADDNDLVPSPETQVEASELVEEHETSPEKEDESSPDDVVDGSLVEPLAIEEGESSSAVSTEEEAKEQGAKNDRIDEGADCEEVEESPQIPSSEVEEEEATESEVDEVLKARVDDPEQQTEVEDVNADDDHSKKSDMEDPDSSEDKEEENGTPQENDINIVNDVDEDGESTEDYEKNVEQSIEVKNSVDKSEKDDEGAEKNDVLSDSSSNDDEANVGGEKSGSEEDEASENVVLSPSSISKDDLDETLIPVNFGDSTQDELKKVNASDLQEELDKSNSELLKLLEQSGIFSDESAQAAVSLSSFFDGKNISCLSWWYLQIAN